MILFHRPLRPCSIQISRHALRALQSSSLLGLTPLETTITSYSSTPCRFSTSLNQFDVNSDSDEEDRFPVHHTKVNIAEIGRKGSHITLNYDHDILSTYHASWLWSNDPKKVTLPSGQRTCTPGQWRSVYDQPKIKSASIVYCGDVDNDAETSGASQIQVPGPTSKDCCHPLAIYGAQSPWVTAASFADSTKGTGLRPYLQIEWTTAQNGDSTTDSSSLFDVEWLERFRYDDSARANRREKTEIQPIHAIRRSGPPLRFYIQNNHCLEDEKYKITSKHEKDGLVHVNYQALIDSNGQVLESGLLNLLDAVFRDGAAIVSNTPRPAYLESDEENDFPVAHVAKAMSGGLLSHGALYGNIFHVREGEANSKNVAYTSVALCPHQDLAYYESPPGIQLLHCVGMGKGVLGGESTLIDAMAAAYQLRELRPESFEVLVKCPATFVKQRDGACMTYRRPHIVLAEEGYSRDNNKNIFDREIVAVHWSPPFEGPVLLPPDDVDRYYQAYADFEQMVDNALRSSEGSEDLSQYANDYTWERKLSPGEILVFNNRRMLHGRRGFSLQPCHTIEESQRHLVGCYTNIDDTLNQYRVLLRRSSDSIHVMNVCNGSSILP
ncbi:hypothetical protein ACHAXN_007317 [Cyclotella atomus]